MKDTYCSHCGTAFDDVNYPKSCIGCGVTTFDNPLPVVVCVQPVVSEVGKIGLAYGRRAIQPHIDQWTLLGGHMDNIGETVEAAARREFREETGVEMGEDLRITGSYANGKGHVLIAVKARPILASRWRMNRLCPENSALGVLWRPAVLAFPIHTTIAREWFAAQALMQAP